MTLESEYEQNWRSKPMKERLAFVYTNQLFADITLCVFLGGDEYVFKVHKNILAFFSPVLEEKLYRNDCKELLYIKIKGIHPMGLDYVLRKLYHVPSSLSNGDDRSVLLSAYHVAKVLKMHIIEAYLKQEILDEIITNSLVTRGDFWKILELSHVLRLEDITNRLLKFAQSNSKAILNAKSLDKTSPTVLKSVLELDVLNTHEKDILNSVARWQRENRNLPFVDDFYKDLLGCVRFRNLSPLDLCQFLANKCDLISREDIFSIMMHLGNPSSVPLPTWCSKKFRRSMAFTSKENPTAAENVQGPSVPPNNSNSSNFNQICDTNLLPMYLEQKYTDVCFVVGYEKQHIKTHRNILAVGSVVFEKMFFSWVPDTRFFIDIPGHNPRAFDKMLRYFYDDSRPDMLFKKGDGTIELFNTALKYGGMKMRNACSKSYHSETQLGPNDFWKLRKKLSTHPGKITKCLQYVSKETKGVLSAPAFLNFNTDIVKNILQLESVSAEEIEILNAAAKWLKKKKSKGGLSDQLKYEILSLVRFSSITAEEFSNFSTEHDGILSQDEVLSISLHLLNKESPLPAWCHKGPPRVLDLPLPYE